MYLSKTSTDMLQAAIQKLQSNTSITNTSAGSVARAIAEMVTSELGDFYSILNFNTQQNLVSTASGQSLDLIGKLYGVKRKTLNDVAALSAGTGVFYFYLAFPWNQTVTIPAGTKVYTDTADYVGRQFYYQTIGDTVIAPGHTRAWATLQPSFQAGAFSPGANTVTIIDPAFQQPTGNQVYCTNPKAIPTQTTQESDDSYRARIILATQTAAGGTLTSIRFAALAVNGVRDVAIRETPFGLGTFQVLVVTDTNQPSASVLSDVSTAISLVRPAGVRVYLAQPTLLPVDFSCSLVLASYVPNINTTQTIQSTTNAIITFLNAPSVGTPLVYNELISAILNATDYTQDVIVNDFAVNGVEVLRQNYVPAADQQIVPGAVTVSIAASS